MKEYLPKIKLYGLYALVIVLGTSLWHFWHVEHAKRVKVSSANQKVTSSSEHSGKMDSLLSSNITVGGKQILSSNVSKVNNPIVVSTDVLQVKIDPYGGRIIATDLLKYSTSLQNKKPIRLLFNGEAQSYTVQAGLSGDHVVKYRVQKRSWNLGDKHNLIVTLRGRGANRLMYTKRFEFTSGSYVVKVHTSIKNRGNKAWNGHAYQLINRTKGASGGFMNVAGYNGMSYYKTGHPYNKLSYSNMNSDELNVQAKGGWIAGQQHYFLVAWAPTNQLDNYHLVSKVDRNNKLYTLAMLGPAKLVQPNEDMDTTTRLYIGPEIEKNLSALAKGLNLTIDYGWLWFIAEALFWLLQHINHFIGNWGLSIILITFLIRSAFYPLTNKSFSSMHVLKKLQPRIKSLQAAHKGDHVKLQKAMKELYKTEKINPLGGCLPMLVQLPVFIALYWMLMESIDLRQAGFLFWHDLSVSDPTYILPLIMGASMFLQQHMSSSPDTDPQQQRMMYIMPLVFTFISTRFPVGLVLYMFTNNILTMLQQWYIQQKLNKK